MHVPEENLPRYRALKRISDKFNSLGNDLSNIGEYENANDCWATSAKYNRRAQLLRVPGKSVVRKCIYCAAPEFHVHKGFCLTIMEGALPSYSD